MASSSHYKLAPLIAHRGVPILAPENSLPGFALAAKLGYEWVELDTQASSDKVAMVHHDDELPDGHELASLTSEELQRRGIGEHEGRMARMPTLESCLKLLAERNVGVVVEIKSTRGREQADSEAALEVLAKVDYDLLMVSSFFPNVLEIMSRERPDIPLALNTGKLPDDLPDYVSNVHFNHKRADSDLIRVLLERNIGLYSYTVNEAQRAEMLWDMGVAGVFTDNHELLRMLEIHGDD